MGPFGLLLKPMIAAGVLATKMVVATGYWATDPPTPQAEPRVSAPEAWVAVDLEEGRLVDMEVELVSGEVFYLAEAHDERASRASGPAIRPRTARKTDDAGASVVALLESSDGDVLRCRLYPQDEPGERRARCKPDAGSSFVLYF